MAKGGCWLAVASWIVCSGCAGTDPNTSSGPEGRGTVACQTWQDAVCDLTADECLLITRAQCDEQYKSLACKSDDRATECANALNASTCLQAPSNCDLADIADPAPAIKACEDFLTLTCEIQIKCGVDVTMQDCLNEAAVDLPCDSAIGVSLSYETCVEELRALPCTALKGPDSCQGAIKTSK